MSNLLKLGGCGIAVSQLLILPMSKQLLVIWVLMEVVLLGVLMVSYQEGPPILFKLFVLMVLGGLMILSGLLIHSKVLLLLGLLVKLGLVPFHQWVFELLPKLSWAGMGMVVIPLKMAPYLVGVSIGGFATIFLLPSLGVGALVATQAKSMQALLAPSTLFHTAFIFLLLSSYKSLGVIYLFIYFVLLVFVWINIIVEYAAHTHPPLVNDSLIYFFLLALSGMPPFLGFIMKTVVVPTLEYLTVLSLLSVSIAMGVLFYSYLKMLVKYPPFLNSPPPYMVALACVLLPIFVLY